MRPADRLAASFSGGGNESCWTAPPGPSCSGAACDGRRGFVRAHDARPPGRAARGARGLCPARFRASFGQRLRNDRRMMAGPAAGPILASPTGARSRSRARRRTARGRARLRWRARSRPCGPSARSRRTGMTRSDLRPHSPTHGPTCEKGGRDARPRARADLLLLRDDRRPRLGRAALEGRSPRACRSGSGRASGGPRVGKIVSFHQDGHFVPELVRGWQASDRRRLSVMHCAIPDTGPGARHAAWRCRTGRRWPAPRWARSRRRTSVRRDRAHGFRRHSARAGSAGARIVGGCCGLGPAQVAALAGGSA